MKKLFLIPVIATTLLFTGCQPTLETGTWQITKVTDFGAVQGSQQYRVEFKIYSSEGTFLQVEDFYTDKKFYPGQVIEFSVKNPFPAKKP